ncbi:nitroreductase family protein [Halobacteriovorax sp. XZX-3]|uniref:nitroreductase family protein n=1 Tax=unclassified Halobacteriovorax TaxID=2639665 RepID=UPI00371E2F41
MNLIKYAQQRYSAKLYDESKMIPKEKVDELKSVLHLAPSSINIQPWKFTFVEDKKVKSDLADASLFNADKIKQASLLVVFSVPEDLETFEEMISGEMPERTLAMYQGGKEQMSPEQLNAWFTRQLYIALGQALTATAQLGLDSTPMEGIEADKYMEILKMKDFRPVVALAVGYAASDDYNRLEVMPKSRRAFEKVIESV